MATFVVLASEAKVDGISYKKDETVESDKDLDVLFANKFRREGARTKRPRDRDDTLNQSAGRQGDRPDTDRPTPARAARTAETGQRTGRTKPADHDFLNMNEETGELEETDEEVDPDHDAEPREPDTTKPKVAAESTKGGKPAKEGNDAPRIGRSGSVDDAGRTARTARPESSDQAAKTQHPADADDEEVESKFGEDATELFEGAEEAKLQVFHDTEEKKYTVVSVNKPGKPLHTEELKTKQAVKKFLKEQGKKE